MAALYGGSGWRDSYEDYLDNPSYYQMQKMKEDYERVLRQQQEQIHQLQNGSPFTYSTNGSTINVRWNPTTSAAVGPAPAPDTELAKMTSEVEKYCKVGRIRP